MRRSKKITNLKGTDKNNAKITNTAKAPTNKKSTKTAVTQASVVKLAQRVPNGRTLATQDNYFYKQGKAKPKNRRVVVVMSNKYNELAVVPLESEKRPNSSELSGYKSTNGKKTHFSHFVEVMDDEGAPIVTSKKFVPNPKYLDIPAEALNKLESKVFSSVKQAPENAKKTKWLGSKAKGKHPYK